MMFRVGDIVEAHYSICVYNKGEEQAEVIGLLLRSLVLVDSRFSNVCISVPADVT